MSNINSDATGVDINCGASNVEQPPNPVRAEHATRKFTAYPRFMNYSPETWFLYSSRIITDSVARNPVSRDIQHIPR